jgi:hypothetical protein
MRWDGNPNRMIGLENIGGSDYAYMVNIGLDIGAQYTKSVLIPSGDMDASRGSDLRMENGQVDLRCKNGGSLFSPKWKLQAT